MITKDELNDVEEKILEVLKHYDYNYQTMIKILAMVQEKLSEKVYLKS